MSVPLVINGQTYDYPELNDSPPDVNWGVTATDWAIAVTQGMLQKAGGNFVLTADANFGPNFGLLAVYFSSRLTPVAHTGLLRLDNPNFIAWRDVGDTADLPLAVNASNQLTFNGNVLANGSGGDVVGPASATDNAVARFDGNTGKLIQNSSCTIDDTGKFVSAVTTASRAVVTDSGNALASSATTDTQIGYLSTTTSNVQTQLDGKITSSTITVFTSSGTWTKATLNPKFVRVTVIGGGGGGGGAASTSGSQFAAGGGGGGGGCSIKTIMAVTLGATETVTVGAAGAASSAGNNPGGDGGTSSFGAHAVATGGTGGLGMGATTGGSRVAAVSGGQGSSGDLNFGGGAGGSGVVESQALGLGFGGSSYLAGSVRQLGNATASAGNGYGGGGAGADNGNSQSSRAGGAGAAGVVIVEEFY